MINIIIWIALTMSIGTGVLAVWVFRYLNAGFTIVGDSYNLIELILATSILVLVVISLVGFTVRKLRER